MKKVIFDKRGIVSEYLPWLLISIALLVIVVLAIFVLKEKGFSIIDQIKTLFKGR